MLVTRGLIAAGAALCAWYGSSAHAQTPTGDRNRILVRPLANPTGAQAVVRLVRDDEPAPSAWIGVRMSATRA
jgi:hypothetical protein